MPDAHYCFQENITCAPNKNFLLLLTTVGNILWRENWHILWVLCTTVGDKGTSAAVSSKWHRTGKKRKSISSGIIQYL